MFDGLDADRRGEVRLARARTADEDYIVRILQKLAAVKLSYERLVDFATGEVEAGKVAIVWETGRLELVGRRSDLPVGRLRLQELRQDWQRGLEGWRALFGQLAAGAVVIMLRSLKMHGMAQAVGWIMTHGAPP